MPPPPARPTVPPDELAVDVSSSDPRGWLSALADGQVDAVEPACGLWRDDAVARQTWHAYHLIGDVLRSEELAREPGRDAAFLAGLRERLAAEPVVLAPETSPARERARQPWLLPAAAAAGFMAVAGVLVVLRLGSPGSPAPAAVLAGTAAPGFTAVSNAVPPAAPLPTGSAGFIRDPRLDEYLRVHQAAVGGVAAASPGGTLRRVDVVVPGAGGPR
jgi:sigma-E factor negative regulatory protein RseA